MAQSGTLAQPLLIELPERGGNAGERNPATREEEPPAAALTTMNCCRRGPTTPTRVVRVNDAAGNRPSAFPNNAISNTKYNPATFIFLNLYEQFG